MYVYLHASVERLLHNIAMRGRDYERHITPEYLKKIQDGYFESFRQEQDMRILVLDIGDIDFVKKEQDYQKLKEKIFEGSYEKGVTRIKV
jgi:deoxyadenosine/deoxycytidine kinase